RIAPLFPLPPMIRREHVDALRVQHTLSETELSEVVAIAPCAGRRRPHAGQHILLGDDPTRVPVPSQRVAHVVERHHPAAQLTEDTVPDGGVIVPPLAPRTVENRRVAVLRVDMPDTLRI